jgi:predicted MPP superfamily phosphohydrolase
MSTFAIRFLIIVFILIALDLYAYQAFRTIFRIKAMPWIYWGITLLVFGWLVYAMYNFASGSVRNSARFSYLFGVMILLYVPKMLVAFTMAVEDVYRIGFALWKAVLTLLPTSEANAQDVVFIPSRRSFISQTGILLAALPFVSILYGITRGKYDFRVRRQVLHFDNLPDSFDGFTITQISDLHSGSFDNRGKLEYAVELINKQASEAILFTGDLVNNHSDEMEPWVELFENLKAPYGKFSILGNHDYGDYVQWNSAEEKRANFENLLDVHRRLGFHLLRNEHISLEKEGDKLHIAGVENWGLPPFPQYGDLNKALQGLGPKDPIVLMSHDPSHFDAQVRQHPAQVELTLSGHTHGMQFGIEVPGFRWSPVKYRYPKWAGLYSEGKNHLYVNRGFGVLAFPGRVGIWPEITVIELRKAQA